VTSTESPEESLKRGSRFLRGTIVQSLGDRATGSVTGDDAKLLKFHGTYQQDDRDVRVERMEQKLEPEYQFMVRVRMPGGVCQPWQWLELDRIARTYASDSLRVTTRQTFQLHGVIKENLRATIAGINEAMLSTIAACGDVNRNVVCHNNPYLTPMHGEVYRVACALSEHFLPRTRAYHEIWLDGHGSEAPPAATGEAGETEEPLYRDTYLPRKFKMGIALPPYNDIDVFAQDLGYIAIVERDALAGFNVSVGGGMGMSHNEPDTYPRLGTVVGFCTPERVLEVARAVVEIQRDFGDRANRKHARFKYTIDDRGLDWLHDELEQRLGARLDAPQPYRFDHNRDPEGWVEDSTGMHHLTLNVLSGRIRGSLLDAFREIAQVHEGELRLTTNQNVTIARVPPGERARIDAILKGHGIDADRRTKSVERDAISCVALPTCGLAMAESERMLPAFLSRLGHVLDRLDLTDVPITVRVSGCPNGCSRPYLGEIALVGKSLGRYDLLIGADSAGTRMNRLYRTGQTEDEVLATLTPILERFARDREPGEGFGDYVVRAGYVVPVREAREFNRSQA